MKQIRTITMTVSLLMALENLSGIKIFGRMFLSKRTVICTFYKQVPEMFSANNFSVGRVNMQSCCYCVRCANKRTSKNKNKVYKVSSFLTSLSI